MKTTRTVLISLFVLIALFFAFRSAEAAPGSPAAWLRGEESASRNTDEQPYDQVTARIVRAVQPAVKPPVIQQAPDADADLSVAVLDKPDPVLVSRNLTYTVTVTNHAITQTVTNVVMTDTLPGTVALVSATALNGGTCGSTAPVVCQLGSLLAGADSKVVIVVIPNSTGTLTNSAFARAAEPDPDLSNNTGTADTTVNPLANLSITKTDNPPSVAVGGVLQYTLGVSNAGPSAAASVTVADTLPAALGNISVVSQGTLTCGVVGQVLTCTQASLASGGSTSVIVQGVVGTGTIPGTISNTATISSATSDPDMSNNSATEATTVTGLANLSITKTDSPASVAVGGVLQYTLGVSNAGPSAAASVTVADTLPAALGSIDVASSTMSCGVAGQVVTCTQASLASGGSTSVIVQGVVGTGTIPGTISNTATISSATSDPDMSNNSATEATTVTGLANLSITKTDSPASVAVGGALQYTLGVSNAGPSAAASVTVVDTLPAALGNISVVSQGTLTCGVAGQVVTCTQASLASGSSTSVIVQGVVGTGTIPGTISNTATISSATSDPDMSNNSATEATTVTGLANLSITKTDSPASVAVGGALQYTLGVSNAGPSAAASVTVVDTLPAALGNISVVSQGTLTCGVAGQVVTCTQASLASGSSTSVIVQGVVGTGTIPGTISNTATISSATSDPDMSNNSATEATTVTGLANLSITKTDSPASVAVGGALQYTLGVSNAGPSAAASVTVVDTLPAALGNISVVSQGTLTCGVVGQVLTCTQASLASGSSTSVIVQGVVGTGTIPGTISNTATISSATSDPDMSNNSATEATTVTGLANLSITKTDKPDPAIAGSTLVYTLTVNNAGPSEAAGVTISDTLPAALTDIAVTSGSWTCGVVGQRVNCALTALLAGGTNQVVVKAKVAANTPVGTQLSNTAVVAATTSDPVIGNNRFTQVTGVTNSADLSIIKVDKPEPVVAGTNLVYTLTVSNAGPSNAAAVTISDTLPAALTNITVAPGTSTCTVVSQLLSCNVGTLLVGGTSRVVVTAKVNPATLPGILTNAAVVGSTTTDLVPANNRATQTTTVTTLADPSITKIDRPDNGVISGSNLVYTLTVSNTGPSNAANIVVSDTLPGSVTYQTIAQGPFGCAYDSGTQRVTCTLTTLAPAGTARAVITTKVNSSTLAGTITNAAVVTTGTTDSNLANNRAAQSTTVITQANLSIAKVDAPDPVIAGTNLVYTLTVANAGPSDALGVVVTDTLPTGLTYQSFTGSNWTCTTPAASKVRCVRSSLTGGTNSPVVLTTLVGSGVTTALFNSAVVAANTIDPNAANNSTTSTTTVNTRADVGVTTLHKPEPVIAGTNLVYTITVANNGPSDAQNVILTENLPTGTNYVSMNTGGASCSQVVRTITCSFTSIVSGTNRKVVVTALVTPGTTGVINNVASLNGTGGAAPNNRTSDLNTANDSSTDPVNVIARSDFSLIKTDKPDPVIAGSSLVYTLTVTNNGPSNAVDAVVTDTLPTGVTYQSSTGSAWTCTLLTGARVRCVRAGMTADTSSSVALNLLVNTSATGTLNNTALVGSSTVDSILTNNTAVQATTANTSADLSIAEVDNPDPVVAGTNLTYTVTVSNLGPSDAAGVVMTDTLPANVTYQSYTGANWTCTLNGVNLRCVRTSNLAASANDRVVILTKVKSATTAALSNSVLVRAATTDPVPTNNSKTEATAVRTSADLRINKLDTVDPVVAGTGMAYTIVITNTGPSDAVGVRITDTLPAGVSYVTHVPTPEWTCQVVSGELRCSRSAPAVASARLQLDVAVLVDSSVTSTLSNLVRVGSITPDPVPTNNSDTELTAVGPQSDLSIAKVESADPVVAGTNLTYTLTVSNAGASHAANLVVTDTLPANVTYQSFGGSSGWTCTLLAGNQLRCIRTKS